MHLIYKTMRILQLHTKMVSGGIEAIVCGLANELSKTEDVTLCTIFKPTEDDVFYKKLSSFVKKDTIGKLRYGFSLKEIFKIYWYIRRGRFDIVHVHGCFQYYFLAMLFLHNKPRFFYTVHSDARMENQTWDWRLFKLKRFMFARKWVVPVTISQVSQKSFSDLYGCSSELIFNGTPRPVLGKELNPINDLRLTTDTKVFFHAGRISKPKNQLVLCKVFDRLIKEGNDVVLAIAGTAEEKTIFEEISQYFSKRIVYLGERNDVPNLMAQSDAFCLPSIWEGLPVTLLEALSVGCIPICSPVGGIVNIINSGSNGLLSKDSSENAYYDTVSRFLNMSSEETAKMKHMASESFEKYDMKNCARNYLETYRYYNQKNEMSII